MARQTLDSLPGEPAVADQQLEADEQRISGKRGERRIGRAAIAGGAERQNLPEPLLGLIEEVDKGICGGTEVSHAAVRGQRRDMQQNSRETIVPVWFRTHELPHCDFIGMMQAATRRCANEGGSLPRLLE